jgi:hypothetical protein
MAGYSPLYIKGMETGLVQSRQEFILPDDAYPFLENAYLFREQIRRRQGLQLLGRLRRVIDDGNYGINSVTLNLYSTKIPPIVPETNAQIQPGSVEITINPSTITGTIIGYNNTTNCEVFTSAVTGLTTGDSISISGVVIVPGSGEPFINGGPYIISGSPLGTSFTINRNSLNPPWAVYASGGTWTFEAPGTQLFDDGMGSLATVPPSGVSGVINYETGDVIITGGPAGAPVIADFAYFPGLPVMGLRTEEFNSVNNEQLVAFDTTYAYIFVENYGWQEFIPGTTWTGDDSDFFWSTNYWTGDNNQKIFWVTNDSGKAGDPIRYTNGTAWIDFAPQINAAGDTLNQCVAMLPFRSRLVAFNTLEGPSLATSVNQFNRIRWAAIGNPFTTVSAIVTTVNPNAWRDDIRGQGGFLDIPTSEAIIAVGYVRDNLVIYCERSTWQLRYTGRTISPFQIEKVNTELGAESTFSAVQFDTSLVGIGDKGIVECDSFKSNRIDIKIPDLVFQFNNDNNGTRRVHGIRDFQQKLAYWIYPYAPGAGVSNKFPNRRIIYNYENDSWAIFTDSLTCLGTYQPQNGITWANAMMKWSQADFPWVNRPALYPAIVGGNQQGYVLYLSSNITPQTTNDESLTITGITGNLAVPSPTVVTSPAHNLQSGKVIKIDDIALTSSFSSLNGNIFGIVIVDADNFQLWKYNSITGQFSDPQLDAAGTYTGGGQILVRDNFSVTSKKFNFLDDGQNIQMGYVDILMNATDDGHISMFVYTNYNDSEAINILPLNSNPDTSLPDTFFNSVVPTSAPNINVLDNSKFWQRVFCPVRAGFITIEWTLSNGQLVTIDQESDVQIDSSILWLRKAGRQLPIGV